MFKIIFPEKIRFDLRRILQPRDIFDLYILSTQFKTSQKNIKIKRLKFKEEIQDKIFEVEFSWFQDTVISYFSEEDKVVYNNEFLWDEIRLRVIEFIKEFLK